MTIVMTVKLSTSATGYMLCMIVISSVTMEMPRMTSCVTLLW